MAEGVGGGRLAHGGGSRNHTSDSEDSTCSESGGFGSDRSHGVRTAPRPRLDLRSASIVQLGPCLCYLGNSKSQRLDVRTCQVLNMVSICGVLASVFVTVAESYETVTDIMSNWLYVTLDVTLAMFFVMEFFVRLWAATDRCRYLRSFSGVLDLATAAASCSWIFGPLSGRQPAEKGQLLLVVRVLRVLRLLKLFRYMPESRILLTAVSRNSSILRVFVAIVLTIIFFFGSLVWAVEDDETFPSIPSAMWWAATTITTVGYGDVVPQTYVGRFIGFTIMLIGYSFLAVPTLVSSDVIGDGIRSTASATTSSRATRALPAEALTRSGYEAEALTRSGYEAEELTRSGYPFFADLQMVHGGAGCISCPSLLDRTVCLFLASAMPPTTASKPCQPCALECTCTMLQPVVAPAPVSGGILVEDLGASSCTFGVGLFAGSEDLPFAVATARYSWLELSSPDPPQLPAEVRAACELLRRGPPAEPTGAAPVGLGLTRRLGAAM